MHSNFTRLTFGEQSGQTTANLLKINSIDALEARRWTTNFIWNEENEEDGLKTSHLTDK